VFAGVACCVMKSDWAKQSKLVSLSKNISRVRWLTRILILTPPGLVQQWREELAQKFGLHDFVTNSDDTFRAAGDDAWSQFPRVIASIAAARLKRTRQIITGLDYDLVIVDEAHHLKNRSSVTAVAGTLHKLATQPDWEANKIYLLALAEEAVAITDWSKADALLKILHGAGEDHVLIFTDFQATLNSLAERLTDAGIEFIPYHGGLTLQQKDAAIRRFETEGRNLQFCHTMVNFDLPWNPQRIEQRVGRIHRVGRTKQVEIFNLSAQGTIEDHLLNILDRKLNMFELVIGEMEMILGYLTKEQDFEEMLLEVWLNSKDESTMEASMNELGDRLLTARDTMRRVQTFNDTLFWRGLYSLTASRQS
jgi:SNF2 family DNA or RNA helicase